MVNINHPSTNKSFANVVDPHLARSEQILLRFTEGGGGDDGVVVGVVVVAAEVVVVVNSEPINRV